MHLLVTGKYDHRIVNFAVHHTDAEWFTEFLRNVKVLDFHGQTMMTVLPGAAPRNGPDALGEVAVKSAKVPTLRFFPSGGSTSDVGGYAHAVPFHADTVVYHSHLHIQSHVSDGSWLFQPRWVPECEEVRHEMCLRVDQEFKVDLD